MLPGAAEEKGWRLVPSRNGSGRGGGGEVLAARLWHLALLSAVCGGATALFLPACSAAVTDIVPAAMRQTANALLRLGQNTVKVGAPTAGAAVIAAVGPTWAIAWDAVSFAGS